MAGNKQKLKTRIFRSYLTSTVSISMVLFLIGMFGVVVLNAERLATYVRENIGFTLILNDNVKEIEVIRLQKMLDATPSVKSSTYVDKETAAKQLQKELGEDFTGFLGFNPLLASIDVKLYAAYTNPDSLAVLEKNFLQYPQVKEVTYQRDLVNIINENVRKIGFFLVVFSGLLLLIFSALINNTIRMSIYSQRFVINTMQLVGATRSFIRRPFVMRSILYGLAGALVANILLFALILSYSSELNGVIDLANLNIFMSVFIFDVALGIIISWGSTVLAVNKFLRMKFDELFY
jgi:cell division transport system permease protein